MFGFGLCVGLVSMRTLQRWCPWLPIAKRGSKGPCRLLRLTVCGWCPARLESSPSTVYLMLSIPDGYYLNLLNYSMVPASAPPGVSRGTERDHFIWCLILCGGWGGRVENNRNLVLDILDMVHLRCPLGVQVELLKRKFR